MKIIKKIILYIDAMLIQKGSSLAEIKHIFSSVTDDMFSDYHLSLDVRNNEFKVKLMYGISNKEHKDDMSLHTNMYMSNGLLPQKGSIKTENKRNIDVIVNRIKQLGLNVWSAVGSVNARVEIGLGQVEMCCVDLNQNYANFLRENFVDILNDANTQEPDYTIEHRGHLLLDGVTLCYDYSDFSAFDQLACYAQERDEQQGYNIDGLDVTMILDGVYQEYLYLPKFK